MPSLVLVCAAIARKLLALQHSSNLELSSPGLGLGATFHMSVNCPRVSGKLALLSMRSPCVISRLSSMTAEASTTFSDRHHATGTALDAPTDGSTAATTQAASRPRSVTQPLEREPVAPSGASTSACVDAAAAPADPPRALFRVLHAEDDRILQRTVPLRTFKKVDVPWDTALDGAMAVEMVTREGAARYELIVMDNQASGCSQRRRRVCYAEAIAAS